MGWYQRIQVCLHKIGARLLVKLTICIVAIHKKRLKLFRGLNWKNNYNFGDRLETGCDCCWFEKAKMVHDFGTISKIPVIVLCSSMLSFPVSIFMYICIVGEFFLGFWMSALIPTHFIFSPIGCACACPRSLPPVAVTSSLAQSSSA